MSATIPIQLNPVTVPVATVSTDINELLHVIARYMSASIQQDVSFFQTVAADPSIQTTPIIFNVSQGVFKFWNTGTGSYLPVTQFQPGDIKSTFVAGDAPQIGWVTCDGREISTIQGLSQNQLDVLNQLFGIGGTLPTLALQAVTGLPRTGSFTEIAVSDIAPPANQIGNLPFGADYSANESQTLAANTEVLRTSAQSLKTTVASMKAASENLLAALNNSGSVAAYVQVFCGYP